MLTLKELTKEEKTHFGDHLHKNESKKDILLVFINIHNLPESRKGEKIFNLTNLMLGKGFDSIVLADTGQHFLPLPDKDKIPQRFIEHLISQQLDSTTSYNRHDTLSGSYQYSGTLSLPTGNIIGIIIEGGRDFSGLGRWSWQRFRGKL